MPQAQYTEKEVRARGEISGRVLDQLYFEVKQEKKQSTARLGEGNVVFLSTYQ